MKSDFCGGDHPNGHCSFQINPSEEDVHYLGNQGRQVGSPIIIIILKVGEAIKIKVLDGNKMLVHLVSKAPFNNNNHYILYLRRGQVNWRIPCLCKHHCPTKRILTLLFEV